MWFKLFVLLRLPISALCLFGYAIALGMSSSPASLRLLDGVCVLAPLAFLMFVSIQLVRFRKGALMMAGWLLGGEVVGVLLPLVGADYVMFGKVEPITVAGVLVGALLLKPGAKFLVHINYIRQITEVTIALVLTFGLTLTLMKVAED